MRTLLKWYPTVERTHRLEEGKLSGFSSPATSYMILDKMLVDFEVLFAHQLNVDNSLSSCS